MPDDVAHFPGDTRAGCPALAARGSAAGLSPVGGATTGTKYPLRAFDPVTLLSVDLAAATAALWAVLLTGRYNQRRSVDPGGQ